MFIADREAIAEDASIPQDALWGRYRPLLKVRRSK